MAECSLGIANLANCSIGLLLNLECHKISKCVLHKDLINVTELSKEELELLQWRTNLNREDLVTICLHHKSTFLTIFESSQWKCCDPYNLHKKAVRNALRPISISAAQKFRQSEIFVKPGEKLCTACRKSTEEKEENYSSSDDEFVPIEIERTTLDSTFTEFGVSSLKTHGVSDKIVYGKRKLTVIKEVIGDKVAKVLNVPTTAVLGLQENVSTECLDCADLKTLIQDLKNKCNVSTNQEKVRLLTMVPSSWSIEKVAIEFDVEFLPILHQYMEKHCQKKRSMR